MAASKANQAITDFTMDEVALYGLLNSRAKRLEHVHQYCRAIGIRIYEEGIARKKKTKEELVRELITTLRDWRPRLHDDWMTLVDQGNAHCIFKVDSSLRATADMGVETLRNIARGLQIPATNKSAATLIQLINGRANMCANQPPQPVQTLAEAIAAAAHQREKGNRPGRRSQGCQQ